MDPHTERVQRIVRAASRPEPIRDSEKVFLVDRVQQRDHRSLDNLVLQGGDRERALPAIRLGDVHPPRWQCPIPSPLDPMMQVLDIAFEVGLIVLPRQPIHPRGGILLQFEERRCEQLDTDVVEERGEPLLRSCPCGLPYAFQLL